jgi:dTDP-4-amino-4,6-dideoxygalactose transaminase
MTAVSTVREAVSGALAAMPDPMAGEQAREYEKELAGLFGGGEFIAVSSGTAALHCALAGSGVGPGDEVLVPALSVVMSAAPVTYAGAEPVFFDCVPDGSDASYDDLAAKITTRTRAVMPVYLWGRTAGSARLAGFAASRGLLLIEDACQAIGSRCDDGRLAGTLGDAGCFSTKDGKILWSGEGGFIRTADHGLAARCRAYRTHWQDPPGGQAPLSAIGNNYRLAEPLAAIARANLARFPGLLERRQQQARILAGLIAEAPGISILPDEPGWNGYAPLARLDLPRPRAFARHLAGLGVPNSTGTYHLAACDQRPMFAGRDAPCPNAATFLDSLLAPVITGHDDDKQIRRYADIITTEAAAWPGHS